MGMFRMIGVRLDDMGMFRMTGLDQARALQVGSIGYRELKKYDKDRRIH